MIIFSNIINYCLNTIPSQTKSLFIGLLLGSLYILAKSILVEKNSNNISNYISFIVCFLIGLTLIILEKLFQFSAKNTISTLYLVLSGFLMSAGIIIPGVSSTIILMLLGIYNTYLNAISIINVSILFPIILGVFIGSIIFMKIIKVLLDKFHSQTTFGMIGFSLGSVLILYPTYSLNIESLISVILLILGFIIVVKH